MGYTHAVSGLTFGVATGIPMGMSPTATLGWVALTTGSALAPDLDHPSAAAAHMWGPLTRGVTIRPFGKKLTLVPGATQIISKLMGGHRQGTHSVLGLTLLLLVIYLASLWTPTTAVVVAFAVGLAVLGVTVLLRHSIRRAALLNLALSAAAAWYVLDTGWRLPWWVAIAMLFGSAVHILGDACTIGGVLLSWPTGDRRKRLVLLPILTGSPIEHYLIAPLLWVTCVWVLACYVSPDVPTPIDLVALAFA